MRLRSALYGTVLGLLIPLLAVGPVLAQATLMPNAKQQYLDDAGNPVASGQVFYYTPSTTTKKTIWQDAAETTPQANPVLLDAAGRPQPAGQTYGSGCYQQKVVDSNSVQVWSAVTCSTGSGGSTPAFSEGIMVGTIIPWANTTLPSKYLYTAGQSVLRATYPDLLTALTYRTVILCQVGLATISVSTTISDSIPIGAPIEATCFAPGTTVLSKSSGSLTLNHNATSTASINAVLFPWGNGDGSTTFSIPDLRGSVIAGRVNMPGPFLVPRMSAFFCDSTGNIDPASVNARCGTQSQVLTAAQLPSNIPYSDPGHIHTQIGLTTATLGNFNNTGGSSTLLNPVQNTTQNAVTGITINPSGGQAHPIIQPTLTADYVIKALPDDSPTGPGVSSIQGMTGAITCGANVTCTANSISANNQITINTTAILGGTNKGLLFNNTATVGTTNTANSAVAITDGSGNPSLSTTLPSAISIPSPILTGTVGGSAAIPNSVLVNAATTVNGQTCTLGSTCTIVASATAVGIGATTVNSATDKFVLYNNAGTLGQYAVTGTGTTAVMATSPTFAGIPILNTPTATSLALGGAVIGGNALAVTGTALYNSQVTFGSAINYGGVTLTNAVTGTGKMVLDTSPTIAGPVFSGTFTGTYTLGGTPSIAGSAINSGTVSGSFLQNINMATSGNGGVTGVLPVANGGTAGATALAARSSAGLNIDEATSTGDANGTIVAADRSYYHTALSTARTDTLPAANALNAGQRLIIWDPRGVATASNTVTLARAGSDTINGGTSYTALNVAYGMTECMSDGSSRWNCSQLAGGGGGGAVTSVTVAPGAGATVSGTCTITSSGTCTVAVDPAYFPNFIGGLGLSNDGGSPNIILDVAAGTATDSTNAAMIKIGAFTKVTSGAWVAGTGNNGMGNGLPISVNTWYHVCLVPNAGSSDVYFDTSVTCANKPVGVSGALYRRIGSFKTDASAFIIAFKQNRFDFTWNTPPALDYNITNPGTTAISVTNTVPTGVKTKALLNVEAQDNASLGLSLLVSSLDVVDVAPGLTTSPLGSIVINPSTGTTTASQVQVTTNTSAQSRIRLSSSGASTAARVQTIGWTDYMGQ